MHVDSSVFVSCLSYKSVGKVRISFLKDSPTWEVWERHTAPVPWDHGLHRFFHFSFR